MNLLRKEFMLNKWRNMDPEMKLGCIELTLGIILIAMGTTAMVIIMKDK